MRTKLTLTVVLLAVLGNRLLADAVVAAPPVSLNSLLQEMLDVESIARWPQPEFTCKQASSYDRAKVAPDKPGWFANNDNTQYIRVEEHEGRQEHVMMDAAGPGAIVRFWLTGGQQKGGVLRIYVDGQAAPALTFQDFDLLQGDLKVGAPLAHAHPGYTPTKGGNNLYFPIPYARHCKVTWEEKSKGQRYYHINYRTYAAGTAVQTFALPQVEKARGLIDRANRELEAPVPCAGGKVASLKKEIAAGAESSLDLPAGPGAVRALELRLESGDPKEMQRVLRSVIVKLTFDDKMTAWVPATDFFGTGVGINVLRSWYRNVSADGTMRCRWVMPYAKSARVTLENLGAQPVKATLDATTSPWTWDARSMHFYAAWHHESGLKTPPVRDWNYIRISGRGVYAGDSLALFNPVATWYGEGDEKIWVDGESFPSHLGTGTEDYYGYSYAPQGIIQTPFSNHVRTDEKMTQGWNVMSRTRQLDGIPFRKTLQFDIELMSWKPTTLTYAATTYWYAFPGATSNVPPQPREAALPIPTLAEAQAAAPQKREKEITVEGNCPMPIQNNGKGLTIMLHVLGEAIGLTSLGRPFILMEVSLGCLSASAIAAEYDYYKHLRYPKELVPGVGRDKVEQEGGEDAVGYHRRTVEWWPRKGQDIVDIPEGVPLRTWTRNKGQKDKEVLAGISRGWMASDPETFKAHLVAFRGYGISTNNPDRDFPPIPIAVLRMEDGRLRGVHNSLFYPPMVSREDHDFIHKTWEGAFPKVYATVSHDECLSFNDARAPGGVFANAKLELWKDASPKFNAMEPPKDAKYPRWGRSGYKLVFETPHFNIIAQPDIWGGPWTTPANWIRPDDLERQNHYRKFAMENIENLWTYLEAAGCSMPYSRDPGPNYRFVIHSHRARAAGGSMHCGISDVDRAGIGHEFFHSMPAGGWEGMYYETWCNAGQHATAPEEIQMFPGNFCYPWRNVNRLHYQSSFWAFALADNPNWGHAAPVTIASLAGAAEFTPYHTVARLGQKKGLWKNGVKGFGDWFGEYAARMVTVDAIEQWIIGNKYGMPELSCVYPVYGQKNRYRISNAEAPHWCGFNIIRLKAGEGAKEIAVDFHGIHDPAQYSDWRACIVAVDGEGRARYSPLWNKGTMRFELKPEDKHFWLTVAGTPSAFPIMGSSGQRVSASDLFLAGNRVPRYPWEVTLSGCRPGAPHRRQGDVGSFDDLYGISNNGNKFLDLPVKQEVPIPLTEKYGLLAQEKLAAMLPRFAASSNAITEKIQAGVYSKDGWWERRKLEILNDMARRARFLQSNAKGHPHPNGGGFVADGARVAATAYVGPDAMVLDGARVEDHACIKDFAVILGPKTVIAGNAKVSGRAWVFGDITVSGNARVLEAATVTTVKRLRGRSLEGRAELNGSAVIKGDPNVWLCGNGLTITGGVVVDHTTDVETGESGVFEHGRFCDPPGRWGRSFFGAGADDGALYANWQFNQPKAVLLEDSYVHNNGILHGKPEFTDDGEQQCIVFNGKDQYAEAPPSVADFGVLTIDMLVNCSELDGRLFDFGTGSDECFYLEITDEGGNLALVARHAGELWTLNTSEPVPADEWCRMRVEMDGSEAAIYVNGKMVGKDRFAFKPRDVFAGDRPEGNFIACSRDKSDFFKGKMDHFRIYRAVHKDFNALGPTPYALTQVQEWSEKRQARADQWEARRKAKEAELKAGRYGQMQQEIGQLEKQKRIEQDKSGEGAKLTAQIEKLRKEAEALRVGALKSAHLFGTNPYPGKEAAELKNLQQMVRYHTTADWDYRMREEVDGAAPPKMKEWLIRVRGY